MEIQYISDPHLESQENSRYTEHHEFPVVGDILVLASGIFYLEDKMALLGNFWKRTSENYREVLIVPGNHEHHNYCGVVEQGLQWKWMFRQNIGYHQNQMLRIDDTDFVTSTFWSYITVDDKYFVWKGLNGFRRIMYERESFRAEEYSQTHDFCLGYTRKNLAESTAKHIVVVTHHLSIFQVVAPEHKGFVLNSTFATEYEGLIADSQTDARIYGHSRTNIDTEVCGTKVICNQTGYIFESEHIINGFDPKKFLPV